MWMIFFWPMIMCDMMNCHCKFVSANCFAICHNVIADLWLQSPHLVCHRNSWYRRYDIWMECVTHMNEAACHTYEWSIVSHIWMKQHVTHMNEAACHTYEWSIVSHIWMKQHVTHMNEAACHTYEWSSRSHTWMNQCVTHMNEAACHTYEWSSMSHIQKSRVMEQVNVFDSFPCCCLVCAYICMCVCVYVCMCVCVYVCTCICVFVCMMCVCMLI